MGDFAAMVVIIVLVACGAGVANNYIRLKRDTQGASDEDLETYAGELEDLRNRVEVLERIVTDERFRLSQELDDLERSA